MAVKPINGQWVVEFMQRGVRVYRRLPPGSTKADAQQLESKLRRQIFNSVDLGKLPDPELSKVIDEWLEAKVKGRKAETHTRSHARAVTGNLTSKDSLGNIAEMRDRLVALWGNLSSATINRRLCILKAVAKYAFHKGYLSENLSAKIQLLPEDNARHVYLSEAQIKLLLDKAETPEVRAFIAWGAFTGMRQGEVMALRKDDLTEGVIRIRVSKTGKPRMVPLVPGLKPYLSAIPFKSHKRTLYAGFEAARSAAGLKDVTYHDLRHSTASLLINSGADLYTVGTVLGHKSTQTTKRYAHLSIETQRAAMEKAFTSGLHRGEKKKPRRTRGSRG